MSTVGRSNEIKVGVGLRHAHINDAVSAPAPIEFVEVHAENYFATGGGLHQILSDINQQYSISLHATAMGLGSVTESPQHYLSQLKNLLGVINPMLISDHAAFGWGQFDGKVAHAGDLLPVVYNAESLTIMAQQIDRVQQYLGRQILVENLSAYLKLPGSTMSEPEYLVEICEKTGCGLLLDLNNILVNAYNDEVDDVITAGTDWLGSIPADYVKEIHLAGFTPPTPGSIAIDDHAQPVSKECWTLFARCIQLLGPVPTLIEWDNNLPTWETLIQQANQARHIIQEAQRNEQH